MAQKPFKIKWVIQIGKTKYYQEGGNKKLLREAKLFSYKELAKKKEQELHLPNTKIIRVKITGRSITKFSEE